MRRLRSSAARSRRPNPDQLRFFRSAARLRAGSARLIPAERRAAVPARSGTALSIRPWRSPIAGAKIDRTGRRRRGRQPGGLHVGAVGPQPARSVAGEAGGGGPALFRPCWAAARGRGVWSGCRVRPASFTEVPMSTRTLARSPSLRPSLSLSLSRSLSLSLSLSLSPPSLPATLLPPIAKGRRIRGPAQRPLADRKDGPLPGRTVPGCGSSAPFPSQ